jgi:hypothetical protein
MTQQHPEIRPGILRDFNAGSYLAAVQLTGSLPTFLGSVPVSRAIASGDMTAGRAVAVAFFDPSNPRDAVVFAVWD